MVDPAKDAVMKQWDKQIIATPVPFADWGAEERILGKSYGIVPADITGWLEVVQLINEDFNSKAIRAHKDWNTDKTNNVNTRDIDGLRDYLDDEDLFQWLCASCIYHSIRWEVLIEIGRAVLNANGAGYKLTYTNLLKIARIDWVAKGSFPTNVRLALLKALTAENELIARKAMVRLLSESDDKIGPNDFSYEEKTIQQWTDSFVLYANDKVANASYETGARQFAALWANNQLADATLRTYLENENSQWNTPLQPADATIQPTDIKTWINSLTMIEPPEKSRVLLWTGAITLFLLLLCVLLHTNKPRIYHWGINEKAALVLHELPEFTTVDLTIKIDKCYSKFAGSNAAYTVSTSLGKIRYPLLPYPASDTDYSRIVRLEHVHTSLLTAPFTLSLQGTGGKIIQTPVYQQEAHNSFTLAVNGTDCSAPVVSGSDTTKWYPASLPSFLYNIWNISVNGRPVTFDLDKNLIYYSSGTGNNYSTYNIVEVRRSAKGVYKVLGQSKQGADAFFLANVTQASCDFSVCEGLRGKTLDSVRKISQNYCDYYKMTPWSKGNPSETTIFYPVNGEQLSESQLSKLKLIHNDQEVYITHYAGMFPKPVSIVEQVLKQQNIAYQSATYNQAEKDPFSRDYDVLIISKPTNTGQTLGVVFGGDVSFKLAAYEKENAAKLGVSNVTIYLKEQSYRCVALTNNKDEAQRILSIVRKRRKDAYIVNMNTWCPNSVHRNDYEECQANLKAAY